MSNNDLYDLPSTSKPVLLNQPQLTDQYYPLPQADTVMLHPSDWSSAFKSYLNTTHPKPFSTSRPLVVELPNTLLHWPIMYDELDFIATFGRICRSREDVRRLAATVLWAMAQKYPQLGIDPGARGIQEGTFYGAHLRTAADAAARASTPYSSQAENLLSQAAQQHLNVIYVACRTPADVVLFTEEAATQATSVETKAQLLAQKGFEMERRVLEGLTWDQQELVDYEVLLRASRFGGTWQTSFAWGVAMRRHIVAGGGGGRWVPLNGDGGGSATRHVVEKIPVTMTASSSAVTPNRTSNSRSGHGSQSQRKSREVGLDLGLRSESAGMIWPQG